MLIFNENYNNDTELTHHESSTDPFSDDCVYRNNHNKI